MQAHSTACTHLPRPQNEEEEAQQARSRPAPPPRESAVSATAAAIARAQLGASSGQGRAEDRPAAPALRDEWGVPPSMRSMGLTDDEIDQLMVRRPAALSAGSWVSSRSPSPRRWSRRLRTRCERRSSLRQSLRQRVLRRRLRRRSPPSSGAASAAQRAAMRLRVRLTTSAPLQRAPRAAARYAALRRCGASTRDVAAQGGGRRLLCACRSSASAGVCVRWRRGPWERRLWRCWRKQC